MNTSIKFGTGLKETVSPRKEVNFFNVNGPPDISQLNGTSAPLEVVNQFETVDITELTPGNLAGVILVKLYKITEPGTLVIKVHNADGSLNYQSVNIDVPDPADEGYEYWNYWWAYDVIYTLSKNDTITAEVYWNDKKRGAKSFDVIYNPAIPDTEPGTNPASFPWVPLAILGALVLLGNKN
jgi:hypothetical protein